MLQQELRIQAAEENSFKEMKMRKRAEEQVEDLHSQIATLKDSKKDCEVLEVRANQTRHHFNQRKELSKMESVIKTRNSTIRELEDRLAETTTRGWRDYQRLRSGQPHRR